MILHSDRYSTGAPTVRNGVVVHDSEGAEGLLPWGQMASAQLVGFLAAKGDRPSPTRPGAYYGAGYQAVAKEDGTYITVGDDNVGPYHAGGGFNPNMWSICIPGRASQNRQQWLEDVSRFYVLAVARYIVDRWNHDGRVWPLKFRTGAELVALKANTAKSPTGYTSHAQVTQSHLAATDHSDPGVSFPWDVLAADIAVLAAGTPVPPQTTSEEDTMYRSNLESRSVGGQSYGPGKVWYELLPGGTLRHVTSMADVICALGGTEADCVNNKSVQRTNAVLDALGG